MENDGDRHDNRKFLESTNKLTLLASSSFRYLNVSNQYNIPSNYQNSMAKGKGPCDNCGENNMLQIDRILVTRPILRRPRRSAQLVGEVVNAAVDAVADAKVATRSGEMITRTGI